MGEGRTHGLLIGACGVLCSAVGLAGVGNTVDCAHCGTSTTSIPYAYATGGSSTQVDVTINCNGLPCNYADNQVDDRMLFANPRVSSLKFVFDDFQTEPCCDKFYAINANSGEFLLHSGFLGAFTTAATVPHGGLQANPLFVEFQSDINQNFAGFEVSSVQACCQTATDTSTVLIEPRENVTGILMGSDDTVTMTYQRSDPASHGSIAMDGVGADADLFVRCGAAPTDAAHDYVSDSFDAGEFIHLPANYCATSTMYISVHSFSGAGMFRLMASDHIAQRHMTDLSVGFQNWTPTSTEMTQVQNTLTTAARETYAASDGVIQVESYKLWKNVSCSNCGGALCRICINSFTGNIASTNPHECDTYVLQPDAWVELRKNHALSDPQVLVHEMGHFLFCNKEEYEDQPCGAQDHDDDCDGHTWESRCGHSLMGNKFDNNYCTSFNHRKDGKSASGSTVSGWDRARATGVVPLNSKLNAPGGGDTWAGCDFQDRGTNPQVGRITVAN